ncbi:XRE family transcriptional regulator [Pandoraea sp. CB10b_02]|uniref:XRE family transcriptional regulator n=1 Tax=Pandoraea sp. CB10b_02 TaxID=2014535 RepID=UPI00257D773C|nr:XRE family transcriptional regulator [Pandoraea sp. CB10b_02]
MQDFPAMTQGRLVFNLARMNSIHARIKALREKLSISMETLASTVGVSWQTVQQWENGKTAPQRKRLQAVADALHTTVDFLMTGGEATAGDQEFVTIKRLDVKLSAGHGHVVESEDEKSRLSFRADFLRSAGATPDSAVSVTVKGDSMEPLIPDGSTILVNRSDTTVVNGKVYAIRQDGKLLVKRLYKVRGGGFVARSENTSGAYSDIPLDSDHPDFDILGRAFWVGFKL